MKYYNHDLYIRRKYTREQIDRFFEISENDFTTYNFEQFFNDAVIEILNKREENKDRAFAGYVYFMLDRFNIKNKGIESYEVYFMTKKQIEKHLKGYEYEVSKSYVRKWIYRWVYYYAVFVKSEKKEIKNDWK
ncbi:hypothetical protein SKN99_004644 [Salmonella enterica]|uniref:Uncharacterized protein n=1 Tax=Salmonella enterica subsp. enterica serovar Braenderup TaxID=149391 RepID=A0A5X8N5E8_SALET|nr:hypothetical protein [Salmonella enterica subsp. enterica serovar Alachua]ECA0164082.1 hypothetical protein [Salmonella enterica subsp. enterica serovar Ohio]ECB0526152.1 hypothetical protein [Salmonella enterica subsp. enterica serovar Braenderup]EDB3571430.1 hypothetical protein [Salmonella enterica subsp. enterica serovar Mbandaka]ELX7920456.1 hypothetical protein [Salmonella enterica]HBQ1207139.1 hypothetical protein [Klebsiella pneumoniae]HBV8441971.1 hypothetical protein [Escherichia